MLDKAKKLLGFQTLFSKHFSGGASLAVLSDQGGSYVQVFWLVLTLLDNMQYLV